jgi:molybdenum cofactor cytidylyltransferase
VIEPKFAAVILAGGLSSRMEQLKPLLPLGDATVTDFVISTFRSTNIDVFLVVGHRQEEIKAGIKQRGVTIIYNPEYTKGMFSSVQAGVREIGENYHAFFLLPVDVPMVRATTIKQMINTGLSHPKSIMYPVHNGKRGHPPLIPTVLIPGIMKWEHEGGLKTFLKSHEDIALDVPVNDHFILFDIDTPDDYKELQKHYGDYSQFPGYSK